MRNAQLSQSLSAEKAASTPDSVARIVGITFSALVAATFWTFLISFACKSTGLQAEARFLEGIAIAIIVFVSIAMAAIPASD